jgi:SAM-dependent methyltransferase
VNWSWPRILPSSDPGLLLMSFRTNGSPDPGAVPSMLDLVRLSSRTLFPPGGKELYRQIALLTDMQAGEEVLVAACGVGVTAQYFVQEFGVQGSGIDEDPHLIEKGEERVREAGLQGRLQLQQGSMGSLPYRDGVFDVVVAELGLTATVEPDQAVQELVRVTRPGGRIALAQLVWKAPVDPERRKILTGHLGARPVMLVELKRSLRAAGVENLHTEAWSDEKTAFRPQVKKPFPDFAELFSIPEKLAILRRAWRRWGWRGVRIVLTREREVHRLLTRERILGLDMVKGIRQMATPDEDAPETSEDEATSETLDEQTSSETSENQATSETSESQTTSESSDDQTTPETSDDEATRDLPLFRGGEGDGGR